MVWNVLGLCHARKVSMNIRMTEAERGGCEELAVEYNAGASSIVRICVSRGLIGVRRSLESARKRECR